MALSIVVFINIAYRFDRTLMTTDAILAADEPKNWISRRFDGNLITSDGVFGILPGWLPIPLPFDYLIGLATIRAQNTLGHGGYFAGSHRSFNAAYFPTLLLIKTPLTVLLPVVYGCVAAWKERWTDTATTRVLTLFGALFLLMACLSRINIGVRHILPLYPILIVLAARSLLHLHEVTRQWGRRAILACAAAGLAGVGFNYPHFLGAFNLLVGGSRGGLKISVIGEDWGQDVHALANRALSDNLVPLYYPSVYEVRILELESMGIDVTRLSCGDTIPSAGWLALHITRWKRHPDGCFEWTLNRDPEYSINHHILVWRIPEDELGREPKRTDDKEDKQASESKSTSDARRGGTTRNVK